jgi:two-component system sensor histidine kinase HydH
MSRRAAGDPELPVMGDIVARIDSLGDLINDLMVFARPRPPQPSVLELRPLIHEAVDMLRRDPAGAALNVAVEGPDVTLTADADLVRATLLNLLLNAAQAMNGHGRITVTVTRRDDACVIRVSDTGPGIEPAIRDQVFEPFFTTKARGGGLGLPIARRTAELHGGHVMLECPREGGTTVTLTLPVPPATAAPAPGTAGGTARTSRIPALPPPTAP